MTLFNRLKYTVFISFPGNLWFLDITGFCLTAMIFQDWGGIYVDLYWSVRQICMTNFAKSAWGNLWSSHETRLQGFKLKWLDFVCNISLCNSKVFVTELLFHKQTQNWRVMNEMAFEILFVSDKIMGFLKNITQSPIGGSIFFILKSLLRS